MRKIVYLAGPINHCTKEEANDWRDAASSRLADFGITGISPLRCEPLVGERYGADYPDPRFGTPNAIASKNKFDVANCDMMLAYFPPEEHEGFPVTPNHRIDWDSRCYRWPSVGTIWELGMARMAGKMTIVVCQNTILAKHPVIRTADWMLDTLEEGLDVAIGVLQDYAKGNLIQRVMGL
jgi:nucleoside 2-deoxyribosyltransferase